MFECVQNHLKTPGFFIFDVINENHCLWTNGHSAEHEKHGIKWKQWNIYEPLPKKLRTFLEFEQGIEIHEQIPLEYDTIVDIARRVGLSTVDVFSNRNLDAVDENSRRFYFVLRNDVRPTLEVSR